MAIKLIGTYAKRLGLPGYSSHQFSVSCETELTDLSQVPAEAARLYGLLQQSVDREIQQTGFVPGHDYGEVTPTPIDHQPVPGPATTPRPWRCSDKQRELILGLAGELGLDQTTLDQRAQRLFRLPVAQLNKLSASGLISDLLTEVGPRRASGNGRTSIPTSGATHNGTSINGQGHGYPNGHAYRRNDRTPALDGRKGGGA